MDGMTEQNAEDLHALFSNAEKLNGYSNMTEGKSFHKCNAADLFHMELPFEEIKAIVIEERDLIFGNFKGTVKLYFEHIGSTSIKGMPGTMVPDGMLMEENFPPSKETIQALLVSGWKFTNTSPMKVQDLWFRKIIDKDPLKDMTMILHVTHSDNKFAKLMVQMRDLCNSDKEAFEDYKQTKVDAALSEKNFLGYKRAKDAFSWIQAS